MLKRTFSALILVLLLTSMLALAFEIQPVRAIGTIYIKADGSIEPADAPILRDGDVYTATEDITVDADYGIVIEKDNIRFDGAGCSVKGTSLPFGIYLLERTNVTIVNVQISSTIYGVFLKGSSNNTVIRNNVTESGCGIWLDYSSNNTIVDNRLANNELGIHLMWQSENNSIYHNDIANNAVQASTDSVPLPPMTNFWDNGYPCGGNFWSDYSGVDSYSGLYQNELGGDAIGDSPYVIDANNQDNYPLMGPWTMQGENVTVNPSSSLTITFADVASEGITTVNRTQSGPEHPPRFKLAGEYYVINTTANYLGNVTLRIVYDDTDMTPEEEASLQLWHWNETLQQWEDITTQVDTENNMVYGETASLSPFAIFKPFPWDVTGDGYVGIDDIFTVASHFGAEKGQPNYEPLCDINGDGYIGIDDIFTAAQHFGQEG